MKSRIAFAVVATLAVGQLPLATAARPADDRFTGIAISHLREHAADYAVSAADLESLRVTSGSRSSHTGVEHRYLRQQVDGLDVITGDASVALMPTGGVLHVGSSLLPDIHDRVSGELSLSAESAVRAAAVQLGIRPDSPVTILKRAHGPERVTALSPSGISKEPIPARLVYQPEGDRLRLAWELIIDETMRNHWWDVKIDAQTGRMLDKHDYVLHEPAGQPLNHAEHADAPALAGGAGSDARLPTPLLLENGVEDGSAYNVYPLPLDSPNDGPRAMVENPADPLASPHGWHDTNNQPGPEYTITRGNNVHAYADFFGPAPLQVALFETESSDGNLEFDHPIDFQLPPQAWRDAAITNLFYWNNVIHDVFYRYGFDEASGNFQDHNYGRGPISGQSDAVIANGQDNGGVNNANFATPADGSSGRMQMYLWAATAKRQLRDGDLDAGIIIHEYGHGISIRLTGGRNNVSCLRNTEQAGEGWSDFFAIALTALESEGGDMDNNVFPARRGLAAYSNGQDKRSDGGIRPTRYWTVAPSPTYDYLKTSGISVPHDVGYVWAFMLWEMFWALVDVHGFNPNVYEGWDTGGNNLALQLVTDGLKLQRCSPGFVDSRDAILAADDALTGTADDVNTPENEALGTGANRCIIWGAFAKRGLGHGALQGSSGSLTDGTQSFQLPPGC